MGLFLSDSITYACVFLGCLVAGWYPNDIDDWNAGNNEKRANSDHTHRTANLATADQRHSGVGQGLVHVPDQYGSHEKPNGLPWRCR